VVFIRGKWCCLRCSAGLNPLDRRVWFSSVKGARQSELALGGVLTPSIEGCGFHPVISINNGGPSPRLNPLDRRVWFSSGWEHDPENNMPVRVLTPSIEGCGFHPAAKPFVLRPRKSLNPLDRRVWFSSQCRCVFTRSRTCGVLTPSIEGCGFHPTTFAQGVFVPYASLNPLDRRVWFSSHDLVNRLSLIDGCLNPLDRRVWFSSNMEFVAGMRPVLS